MKNKNFSSHVDDLEFPRENKSFLHKTEAAVKIYAQQALAIFIGFLPIVFYVFYFKLEWFDILTSVIASWMVAFIFFCYRLFKWGKLATEEKTVAKPPVLDQEFPKKVIVHVSHQRVKENGHIQIDEYDLPGTPEALQLLARGLRAGRPFTETVWAGKNKPFTIPEFRELRKLGIKKYGLFKYVNEKAKNQGIEPTEKGWELMEELADNDLDEFEDYEE